METIENVALMLAGVVLGAVLQGLAFRRRTDRIAEALRRASERASDRSSRS